jgi:hypothetical protein
MPAPVQRLAQSRTAYFNEVLIDENLVLSFTPIPFTTAMIASEIPAAINPYSMAVAPDSSARNRRMVVSSTIAAGPIGQTLAADGAPTGEGGKALEAAFPRFADDLMWWVEAAKMQRQRVCIEPIWASNLKTH